MENPNDGIFVVGKVEYYSQAQLEKDIRNLPVLARRDLVSLIIQSLFTKRNSFSHEAEYRVIYVANSQKENVDALVKPFIINPLDFIENIYFDPRADEAYVERCSRILIDTFKYPKSRIKKSSMYSFKSQPISFVNESGNRNCDWDIPDSLKEL